MHLRNRGLTCCQIRDTEVRLTGLADLINRVSSPVVKIDVANMSAITKSGRRYELIGPPGPPDNFDWFWRSQCSRVGITHDANITAQLFQGF